VKIAWMSNAPWASTGYGQQTALMLPRLRDAGHDVCVIANYGLQGGVTEWDGFRVYPSGSDWSNDIIPAHALHWFGGEPGLLVTLYDAWTLRSPFYAELNMAGWVPVDHTPAPPLVAQHFKDTGSTPIAMSLWGKKQLELHGLEPLYAPHGVDTNVFRPHSKSEAKARYGIDPDRFVVGMVSTNNSLQPCRKAYPEAFAAFSYLRDTHPDALLYVHAERKGALGGMDLQILAQGRGIPPENLKFVEDYPYRSGMISPSEMAWIYSAFDVLLFPSMGEGFGIPAIEAQACGTPIIVSDFSAQAELVAPESGYRVQAQPYWDPAQAADFCMPLISDLVDSLVHAAENRHRLAGLSIPCREFAMTYDADHVFSEYWVPTLKQLEAELPSVEPIRV
jgi:glycosyltransferase involved in cell wall biosynthesis